METLAEQLEFSRQDFFDECAANEGPSLGVLKKVSDYFEISIDDLVDNQIDQEWVKKPTLAPEFQAKAGSRFRTSSAVIRWLESQYGSAPTASLMRTLHIPKNAMLDPDRPVRLLLLGTLLKAARARGLTDSSIFEMGLGAVDISENEWLRKALSKEENPHQLYENVFLQHVQRFESNYEYRIEKCETGSITLRIRPLEERIRENGFDIMADPSVAIYRWGVAAGLLKAIGRGSATVTPLHFLGPNSKDEMVRLNWDHSLRPALLLSGRKPLKRSSDLLVSL